VSKLLKKNQVNWTGQGRVENKSIKPPTGPFRLEIKVPHEKIEQEVLRLRERLVVDVDHMREELLQKNYQLDSERQMLAERQQMILSDSKSELERLRQEVSEVAREEGRQKGFDEGFAEGRDQGQKEFNAIKEDYIHQTKEVFYKIQELNEYKQSIFEKTEPYILSLIEAIVKKVITVEMSIHPDLILDVIREAAVRINDVPHLKINVNPQHAQFLKEKKDVLRNKLEIAANIEIVSNESLHPGGCQLEADYGLVDASVEIKVIGILEILNKVFDVRRLELEVPNELQVEALEEAPDISDSEDDSLFSNSDDSLLSFSDTDLKENDLGFLTDEDDDDELSDEEDSDDDDLNEEDDDLGEDLNLDDLDLDDEDLGTDADFLGDDEPLPSE
jgi:flagellar biosynthesis/type III secretory pathway protein FliH